MSAKSASVSVKLGTPAAPKVKARAFKVVSGEIPAGVGSPTLIDDQITQTPASTITEELVKSDPEPVPPGHIRMIHAFTNASCAIFGRVYEIGPDGMVDVLEDHVETLQSHGFRPIGAE